MAMAARLFRCSDAEEIRINISSSSFPVFLYPAILWLNPTGFTMLANVYEYWMSHTLRAFFLIIFG